MEKAPHVCLEAQPGRELDAERMLLDILACVKLEPATAPWFAVRLNRGMFGIFEAFPNNSGCRAHLIGKRPRCR